MAKTTKKTARKRTSRRGTRKLQLDLFESRIPTTPRSATPAATASSDRKTSTRKATARKTAGRKTPGRKAIARTLARKPRKVVKAKAVKKFKKAAKAKPGTRMALGRGWRLSSNGGKTAFSGTLVYIRHSGKERLALFSVPKRR